MTDQSKNCADMTARAARQTPNIQCFSHPDVVQENNLQALERINAFSINTGTLTQQVEVLQ